jgi:hypothetical protein
MMMFIIIINLSWIWATFRPVPVSLIVKSFHGFPQVLLPFGVKFFGILGNLLGDILFTRFIQFLL